MKPPEAALRELVLQWLDKAAADLDAAERLSTQATGSGRSWRFTVNRRPRST
jgi:hypothetical protein